MNNCYSGGVGKTCGGVPTGGGGGRADPKGGGTDGMPGADAPGGGVTPTGGTRSFEGKTSSGVGGLGRPIGGSALLVTGVVAGESITDAGSVTNKSSDEPRNGQSFKTLLASKDVFVLISSVASTVIVQPGRISFIEISS